MHNHKKSNEQKISFFENLDKKFWICTILSPVVMIGEVCMELSIPLLMSKIVDIGISQRNFNLVLKYGLLMILCASISLCFGVAGGALSSIACQKYSKNLRNRLFSKIMNFSFSQTDAFSSGTLITRLTTDITNIQNVFQMTIRTCFRSPVMLFFGTILAYRINRDLSFIFFVAIPILGTMLILISRKAHPRFKKMFETYDSLNTTVEENLGAIRLVKAFVRRDFENEKFSKVAVDLQKRQIKAEKVVIVSMPVMTLVSYICIISVLWFGGNRVVTGQLLTGELVSFITYVTQILMSMMMLGMIFVSIVLSRAAINRVKEVLRMPAVEEGDNSSKTAELPPDDNSISFEDVSFSYDGKSDNAVLCGINLKINSGENVGIIGATGSSKTTLVQLLAKLYAPLSGKICIGGQDISNVKEALVREKVGIVNQSALLFSGTIKENLLWGKSDATDDEIREACDISCASLFIEKMPLKYEEILEQGGNNLSGGQKQRLCIARTLIKKPGILILDDSTSAVDTATDIKIRAALRKCLPSSTKIIISQRISSIQDCDKIIVMDNGKIDAIGTHLELLEKSEIYKDFFTSQISANGEK